MYSTAQADWAIWYPYSFMFGESCRPYLKVSDLSRGGINGFAPSKISIEAPKKVTLTTEKILKPKKESVLLYSETKTTGWNDKIVALEKT